MLFHHSSTNGLAAALFLATAFVPAAMAQNFSPYFETTGRGAYDLYNDAVACSTLLEGQAADMSRVEERERLEVGARDARDFALFMLGTGNVVDNSGAILAPDNLEIDLRNARFDWVVVLHSIEDEGETPDAEVARCLSIYRDE